ncbi:MAG: hypothetical protein KDD61_03745 [Bdellovibrionales bacterium]|nr:hypothetical protein [Bdellovibrionales bacterium]
MDDKWDIENKGIDFQQWGLFLLAAMIGWLILGLVLDPGEQSFDLSSKAPSKVGTTELTKPSEDAVINRHLAHTQTKLELGAVSTALGNMKTPPINMEKIGPIERSPEPLVKPGVDIVEESTSEEVMRDLNRESLLPERMGPDDRIRMIIARKKWMQRYDQEYRRGFVKEVKAKARAEGFLIEFDDDLNVVKVEELRKREPLLFEAEE